MTKYSKDENRLKLIKYGDQVFLKTVYGDYRDSFLAFLVKYFNCSREDALATYSETFTVFYYNIKDGKLQPPLQSELKTYLFGIGKRIFQKRFLGAYQKRVTFPQELKDGIEAAAILDQYELEAQSQLVKKILVQLKDSCQALIRLMFFEDQEAQEVAKVMGFNSAGAVRKHKYDCLKKMRELLGGVKH